MLFFVEIAVQQAIPAAFTFDLQRSVLNVKPMCQNLIDVLLNERTLPHGNIVCDDVSGEHAQIFVDAPDVQVVNAADTFYGVEFIHHFLHVNILRRALQQNVDGLSQDAPRVP